MTPEKSFCGAAVSKPRQHSTCYYIGVVNYSITIVRFTETSFSRLLLA